MSRVDTGGDFTISICFLVFMGFMLFADVDGERKRQKKKSSSQQGKEAGGFDFSHDVPLSVAIKCPVLNQRKLGALFL